MRRLMKTSIALSLLGALALTGCNGSSGSDDSSGGTNPEASKISLTYKTLVNGSCTDITSQLAFELGQSFCVSAKLEQGATAISGARVDFSTTKASLSPASKLTDANGYADVIVTGDGTLGAGTITATYTPTSSTTALTANRNFEFIQSTTSVDTLTLNSSIVKDSTNITRFKVGETVQLQAQALDAQGQGIADVRVDFAAGSVVLQPSSALTNAQGIAQVPYTPASTELGANSLNINLSYKGQSFQTTSLFEVLSADAVDNPETIKLGHFDSNGNFVEGELATSLAKVNNKYRVSAGGSFGITATLVSVASDNTITRLQTPSSISFSSDCVTNTRASIDSPVTTLSGSASATFQDTSCSGNSERDDQIVATTLVGNQTLSANLSFTLERQTLASLSFESATPQSIRIKGAGGTGSNESSLVTFKVTSANGQPAAQQAVNFSLDTIVGGISFANGQSTTTGITNSQGLASARVLAGTVPTPVRVVASATDSDTKEVITSQSEQLSINTGLPQQLGFTVSPSVFNPEAGNFNGEEVTITAYASDSFGNPAPDDTTINFTAEGGQIQPSCLTANGRCSVIWTSANPRVSDHRITVLAYALGHETFFDTNGNNIFDDADGGPAANACLDTNGALTTCNGNGLDRETYLAGGFSDIGDAFRDDNENGSHDDGEQFFNTAAASAYQVADKRFNGPQCQGTQCGSDQANKTYIRKAIIMTMSGSNADFILWRGSTKIWDESDGTNLLNSLTALAPGASSTFTVQFFDSAGQIMPSGTSLSVTASQGTLDSNGFTVPNTTQAGGNRTSFGITNNIDPATPGTPGTSSTISILVTTPKGIESNIRFSLALQGT